MLLCSNSDESEGKSVATREDLSGPFDKCNMAVPTEFGDLGPRPTFLETLRSKSDSGPVKLPGLSRNGPQESKKNARWLGSLCCVSLSSHLLSPYRCIRFGKFNTLGRWGEL